MPSTTRSQATNGNGAPRSSRPPSRSLSRRDPERNGNHAASVICSSSSRPFCSTARKAPNAVFWDPLCNRFVEDGPGTGHVGLEPGLLFRNEWIRADLDPWGAQVLVPGRCRSRAHGQVLKFATGSIAFGWRPIEAPSPIDRANELHGSQRLGSQFAGTLRRVDGDCIFYLTPGYSLCRGPKWRLRALRSRVRVILSSL